VQVEHFTEPSPSRGNPTAILALSLRHGDAHLLPFEQQPSLETSDRNNDLSHHPARRAAGKVAGATAEPVQAGDDQDVAFSQEVEARLKFRPGSDRGHLLLEYSLDAQPTQLFDLILEASDLIAS